MAEEGHVSDMAELQPRPPASPCVAIVDAGESVIDWLQAGLRAAGFQTETLRLAAFPTGGAALAALVARGVDLVVYDLSRHYDHDRRAFQELYAAAVEEGMPFLVTSARRWTEEEQTAAPAQSYRDGNSPVIGRI